MQNTHMTYKEIIEEMNACNGHFESLDAMFYHRLNAKHISLFHKGNRQLFKSNDDLGRVQNVNDDFENFKKQVSILMKLDNDGEPYACEPYAYLMFILEVLGHQLNLPVPHRAGEFSYDQLKGMMRRHAKSEFKKFTYWYISNIHVENIVAFNPQNKDFFKNTEDFEHFKTIAIENIKWFESETSIYETQQDIVDLGDYDILFRGRLLREQLNKF